MNLFARAIENKTKNLTFLTPELQFIVHIAILLITIYTPILKPILLIKNIVCCSLVSFSIFFAGLSSSTEKINYSKHFELLFIVISFIFQGSFYNELLLDMRDINGDRKNHIKTIPVMFGKAKTWILLKYLLFYNVFSNLLALNNLFSDPVVFIFPILFSPFFHQLKKIKKDQYSNSSITQAVGKINRSLFMILIYFFGLTFWY